MVVVLVVVVVVVVVIVVVAVVLLPNPQRCECICTVGENGSVCIVASLIKRNNRFIEITLAKLDLLETIWSKLETLEKVICEMKGEIEEIRTIHNPSSNGMSVVIVSNPWNTKIDT